MGQIAIECRLLLRKGAGQPKLANISGNACLGSALRLGRGELLVHLSDDDRLIPEGLVEAVSFLDANPKIVACYAPWLIHDEMNEQDIGQFYAVDEDFVLPRRDFGAALAFISERIAFPEMGVYRASALRVSWAPRHFAFWAFAHFAHYLDQGDVAFLRNPYYRYILTSGSDHGTNPAGIVETMTAWDRYRGGLEYLLYFGVKRGALDSGAKRNAVKRSGFEHPFQARQARLEMAS
jgi:hypothetical protein